MRRLLGPVGRRLRLLLFTTIPLVLLIVGTASGQPSELEDGPLVMSLAELEDEISRRQEDLRRHQERLSEIERENETVRRELDARASVLGNRETHVRERIVTLCRLSRGGYVQLLRGAETWTDLVRRAQLARAVMDDDITVLRAHQTEVEDLERQRRELDERLERQRDLNDRITRYRRELEEERQRRLSTQQSFSPMPPPFPQANERSSSYDNGDRGFEL